MEGGFQEVEISHTLTSTYTVHLGCMYNYYPDMSEWTEDQTYMARGPIGMTVYMCMSICMYMYAFIIKLMDVLIIYLISTYVHSFEVHLIHCTNLYCCHTTKVKWVYVVIRQQQQWLLVNKMFGCSIIKSYLSVSVCLAFSHWGRILMNM